MEAGGRSHWQEMRSSCNEGKRREWGGRSSGRLMRSTDSSATTNDARRQARNLAAVHRPNLEMMSVLESGVEAAQVSSSAPMRVL